MFCHVQRIETLYLLRFINAFIIFIIYMNIVVFFVVDYANYQHKNPKVPQNQYKTANCMFPE